MKFHKIFAYNVLCCIYTYNQTLLFVCKVANKLAINYPHWFNNYSLQQRRQLVNTYSLALTAIVTNSQTQIYRLTQYNGSKVEYS
jgi:hypothetical protein